MSNLIKIFSLFIIVISAASGLIVVKSACAQSIPKPSVPQFTLQIVDYAVQLTIENQPIIPNGHGNADIFYNIRVKSHDSLNWVNTTVPNPSQGIRGYIGEIGTSGSTVILESFSSINTLLALSDNSHQIDYQVEAINGYLNATPMYVPPFGVDPNNTPVVVVNTSGWSDTQTITIGPSEPTATAAPNNSSTPTASTSSPKNPTATPEQSNSQTAVFLLDWMQLASLALLAVIAVLLIYVVVFLHKRRQTTMPFK